MATTYTAKSFQNGIDVGASTFPGVVARAYSVNVEEATNDATYAFAINDVIKVFAIPPYVKILNGRLVSGDVDLDDGGNTVDFDLIITDGSTTKTLVNGGTAIGQANATAEMDPDTDDAFMFVTTSDDFYVAIKAIAAATGDCAADATIAAVVEYTSLLEPGEVSMRSGRDNTP